MLASFKMSTQPNFKALGLSPYQNTLYTYLEKLNKQHYDLSQKFVDLSVKQAQQADNQVGGGGTGSEELVAIRKQISGLGAKAKLFAEYEVLLRAFKECRDILSDPKEDKEL